MKRRKRCCSASANGSVFAAGSVVRQISGDELFKNVTQPLPLRIIGGTAKDLQPWQKKNLKAQRNPVPHNGAARDLFAADLLAVKTGQLSHPHEEKEKMLLRIGERLSLRGLQIDKLNEDALKDQREQIVAKSLKSIKGMTLSVIGCVTFLKSSSPLIWRTTYSSGTERIFCGSSVIT